MRYPVGSRPQEGDYHDDNYEQKGRENLATMMTKAMTITMMMIMMKALMMMMRGKRRDLGSSGA